MKRTASIGADAGPIPRRPRRYHDDPNYMSESAASSDSESDSYCGFGSNGPPTYRSSSSCTPVSKGPKRWEDTDPVNAQIAKDLMKLSLKERETIFEDIHGVADPVEETEESLEALLQSMQVAINWIKEKQAYEQARFMLPSSVEDRFLRVAILRASSYNPTKAARRLISYYQLKLDTFGLDCLLRPITQADLTIGMKNCLESGGIQLLRARDCVGRPIIFTPSKYDTEANFTNVIGATWYIFHKLIQDESAQKKGFVFVNFAFEKSELMPSILAERARKAPLLDVAMPIKVSAFHFCYSDSHLRPLAEMVQLAFKTSTRLRIKMHYGSYMECTYKLMSYGVVPSMLPIDKSGNIENETWQKTLSMMSEEDQKAERHLVAAQEQSPQIIPTSDDCLLGRGYPYRSFPGNLTLNEIIRRNQPAYTQLERRQKRAMLVAIIQYSRSVRGCRYLKKAVSDETAQIDGTSPWVLASDEEAISKVGNTMRGPSSNVEIVGESLPYTAENGVSILVPALTDQANAVVENEIVLSLDGDSYFD